MTDKALEAAARVIARDLGGDNYAADDWGVFASATEKAISAYLSALPGEAEVAGAPLVPPIRENPEVPAWLQMSNLFTTHRINPPPTRLRDELVTFMEWAWYGQKLQASLQAMQARAEKAEEALAQLDGGSDHADDILAASAKFQCHECIAEEREFSCHDLEDVVIVEGKVVCKECVAEFYPKARSKAAPDIGKKLRRQRMFARQQQARAEKAERERDDAVGKGERQWAGWVKEEVARKAAEARVKELEEALEPFADFGEFMEVETEGFSDLDRLYLVPEESDVRIGDVFVSAFRRARTALKGGSNG